MFEIKNLAEALAKAQSEIVPPTKNRTVDFIDKNGRRVFYKYADLADCIEAIKVPLSKNNLSISHQMVLNEKNYDMVTVLMHSSGESISTVYPLPDPTAIKPQEFGSALTYARRYSLSSLVGLASEEDDDGGGAPPPPKRTEPSKPQAKPIPNVAPKPPAPPKDENKFHQDLHAAVENQPEPEEHFMDPNISFQEKLLILKHKLGYSNDQMAENVKRVTGLSSTKECSNDDLAKVVNYLILKLK